MLDAYVTFIVMKHFTDWGIFPLEQIINYQSNGTWSVAYQFTKPAEISWRCSQVDIRLSGETEFLSLIDHQGSDVSIL